MIFLKKLTEGEVQAFVNQSKGWSFKSGTLTKEYNFSDFTQAIQFVSKIVPIANAMDHHPDICVYYSKVVISLFTHDINALSDLDVELARKIDSLKDDS
ncbi:4a-hydroxytetrahydrobiopterin dehydratase [Sulfolobales archaeon HS-7]|nr:4a-hydroxytetrahydrobiopterin dehydratase [Sulfolobales archaeon HS-7]